MRNKVKHVLVVDKEAYREMMETRTQLTAKKLRGEVLSPGEEEILAGAEKVVTYGSVHEDLIKLREAQYEYIEIMKKNVEELARLMSLRLKAYRAVWENAVNPNALRIARNESSGILRNIKNELEEEWEKLKSEVEYAQWDCDAQASLHPFVLGDRIHRKDGEFLCPWCWAEVDGPAEDVKWKRYSTPPMKCQTCEQLYCVIDSWGVLETGKHVKKEK